MSGGLRGLLATLRRLVGGRADDRAGRKPTGVPPPAGGREPSLQLGASWQLPEPPSAKVVWKKDMPGLTRTTRVTARDLTIQRQRLLVLAALLTVAIVGIVFAVRLTVDRTLPAEVRGVWRTDGPRYEQRLFELAATRIAFQVSDTAATIHQIVSVSRTVGEEITAYDVEYRHEGTTYVFSFTYYAGPPEELRFVHQPFMIWTRSTDRRTLLPELF